MKKVKCWNCGHEVPRLNYAEINYVPICEHCGSKYPEKPKLEAKLTEYQDEYLNNRTQENLNKLFSPMRDMIFNLICSKLKKKSQCRTYEDIEDMVSWTLCKLVSYYTTKPEFKISGSFVGYISEVIKFPLYNEKDKNRQELEKSIYDPLNDDSDDTILDKLSNETYELDISTIFGETESNMTVNYVMDYVKTSIKMMYEVTEEKSKFSKSLNLMILINHFFNQKSNRFFSEWWKMSDIDLKDKFMKCTDILKENLYRCLMNGK